MGRCRRCGKRRFLLRFPERLDIPEMRAMVSHWPWHRVQVCPQCEGAFDEEFRKRVRLLAPDVVAEEGDVSERVCLLCGNQDPRAVYTPSGRWVDAAGTVVATHFSVCDRCRGRILVNQIVSSAELRSAGDFRTLLAALPEVNEELVRRTEGWSLAGGDGPPGSGDVKRGVPLEAAAGQAESFWAAPPAAIARAEGTPVRGAMILPEKKGAIRTHLRMEWRVGMTDAPLVAAMAAYRTEAGFVLVGYDVRQV